MGVDIGSEYLADVLGARNLPWEIPIEFAT